MPPKVKITREDIVNAAVDIVRKNGGEAINARTLASVLSCSTQPIFSNFATMDELRIAVLKRTDEIYREYLTTEVESGKYPTYKATGMAYIRFAKEERELFRLLYMRDRSGEETDAAGSDITDVITIVRNITGLDSSTAELFHLEMWAYVHGIAVMFATGYLNLEWELVSKMITDVYHGMIKQYGLE